MKKQPPANELSPAVTLDRVRFTYGGGWSLDGFSADFGRGITRLTGASGSGKTTLLRLIAGLEKPASGSVVRRGTLAYVFQEPRLFPWLSVCGNIACLLRGSKESRRAAALRALAEVGLPELAERMPDELSGGQAHRVALARAVAVGADIVLLDEPFAGLDPVAKDFCADLIRRKFSQSVCLLVTHGDEIPEAPSVSIEM